MTTSNLLEHFEQLHLVVTTDLLRNEVIDVGWIGFPARSFDDNLKRIAVSRINERQKPNIKPLALVSNSVEIGVLAGLEVL